MRVITFAILLIASDAARISMHDHSASLVGKGTTYNPLGTPAGSAAASLADAAQLILAGQQARTISGRWRAVKSALEGAQTASKSAQHWATQVDKQLIALNATVANTLNGLGKVLNASITYEDIGAIFDGHAVLSFIGRLVQVNNESAQVASLLGDIASTIVTATGLAQRMQEVSGVWDPVDLDRIGRLELRASDLHSMFTRSIGALTSIDEIMDPVFHHWNFQSNWRRSRNAYKHFDELESGFAQVAQLYSSLNTSCSELQLLAADSAQLATTIVEAEQGVAEFHNRGIGAREEIPHSSCDARGKRTFSIEADVDLGSMSCARYVHLGMQRCECADSDDCYVTSELRPEPVALKRCFRPV